MRCGLIGHPLAHSLSPAIHRFFGEYDYRLFDLEETKLAAFLRDTALDGCNVTVPYKRAVLPFCARLSPQAAAIGSVNTLVRGEDGRFTGHNTDYAGFDYLLRRMGISPAGKTVAILGSGGTARTVQAVCRDRGARAIAVCSRTPGDGTVGYDDPALAGTQILVNTTPVGMWPQCPAAPVSLRQFPAAETVIDVIYNPLRTALCDEAAARGISFQNGLPMLAAQAAASAALFGAASVTDERIEAACAAIEKQQTNIVLIGMPGCGKTAVGQALAAALGRPFVDLDDEVARLAGKPAADLIAEEGEEAFRRWEHEAVTAQGRLTGAVIATGGGVVTRPENRLPLWQNGRILFLQRSLDRLPTAGRPLSVDLPALYARRLPLYRAFADTEVSNDRPLAETVAAIKEEWI